MRRVVVLVILFGISTAVAAAAPKYSDWGVPVNLGPTINTAAQDQGPMISKDGRSLYFISTRPGGLGQGDLWVAQRDRVRDPWGSPVHIPVVNSEFNEAAPALSRNGHLLFFTSNRPVGGFGGGDIWVSWRQHTHDDFGWEEPVNLGPTVNTASLEAMGSYFDNPATGRPEILLASDRSGGPGGQDIYSSAIAPDGSFGPPQLVAELSSSGDENVPRIRHDGLEVFFQSNRTGSLGFDVWAATRSDVSTPWSSPENLGSVNSPQFDGSPSISSDRETLFFNSTRPGFGITDLWVTTRTKLRGEDP